MLYTLMKTWKEFCEAQTPAVRPGGTITDRSLEGFRPLMNQLLTQVRGVQNQQAKAELGQLMNRFFGEMRGLLQKYQTQGIGYSPSYQPQGPSYASNMQPNPTNDLRA